MSFFVNLQKALPKKLITELAGWLAEVKWAPLKNLFVTKFQKYYHVDLSEAEIKEATRYPTFNSFFSRALEESARPICAGENDIASPADGAISQIGKMQRGSLLQVKDVFYSAAELIADEILAARMEYGSFATIYLSPRDYHRVHVPIAGKLLSTTYVPGKLFSVNDATARSLDGLFTRNERIVAEFQTPDFDYALVMVGAMIVGGMETKVTGRIKRQTRLVGLAEGTEKWFEKGEEFGRFHLGSTVIVVLPREANVDFLADKVAGQSVRMGQALGAFRKPEADKKLGLDNN